MAVSLCAPDKSHAAAVCLLSGEGENGECEGAEVGAAKGCMLCAIS